ncbi:membrane protein [Geoanaerobacter pelophilus]|uniref:Probable membrane transporter protein n=1 Tax=Geoanaerobacter pelophilus TaxID=60036 RepID=A0ABQ0MHR8_9BACT|nr:TSUP family transporter [Geoanaerobacter pelophilus]GAW66617.1 membrane protein [Geoanaerobacter pelophilus]
MISIPPIYLPLLFITGAAAGLIDSIAGGGGLITVPVLLGLGLPPQAALGTNKLQGSFGSFSAMVHFVQAGTVKLSDAALGAAWTAAGAVLGTYTVRQLDPGFLKKGIPFLLLAILCYTIFTPKLGAEEVRPRFPRGLFYAVAGLALGFYDGFLGPGTGSFWVVALMLGLGFDMRKGTGYTKAVSYTHLDVYKRQAVGARVGARLVIKKGTRLVRPVFICSVLAVTAKLFWDNYLQ